MKDQTILITGGSSGIGLEMAKQMVNLGNTVIICGRSQEKLDFARKQQKELVTIKCDITKNEDRISLYNEIKKQFGTLDMLINNAGIVNRFLIAKTNNLENIITTEWKTNYAAPILLVKLFLDMLSKNKGKIVNVNSGLAYVPLFVESNYCATKAALHSMTLSMRIQFAKLGIKVFEIFYPSVDTPFQQGHAPENAIEPEVAAKIAIQGLIRCKNEIYVKMAGLIYRLSRLMPKRALKILSSFVPKDYEEILSTK